MLGTENGGIFQVRCSPGPYGTSSPLHHLGQDVSTAYNQYAPTDEVEDASSRLLKVYGEAKGDGGFIPGFQELIGQFSDLQNSERHAKDLFSKALRRDGSEIPNDGRGKAQTDSWGSEFGRGYFRWYVKGGVQFPVLRAFGRRLEVHQAILRTRKRQVDRFTSPSQALDQMGWRLSMVDEQAAATGDVKEMIDWLMKVLMCGGREFNPVERRRLKRQSLKQFLRHLVHDGLELDNSAVELIGLDIGNGLDSWYVRPSETFALANPKNAELLADGREIYAYQVLNGRAEIPFAYDELALFIRNSSTWAEENGYGFSEFEQSLETLNNIIQSITYTKQGLGDSSMPRGILMAYGNFDHKVQNAFKAAWDAKVRGVQNAFNLPVLFSRGQQGAVQYVPTGQPFDEMGFSKWISFNMTVMGGIYGISPEEIGMEGFSVDKSSLSGDDTIEKLAASKEKGLHPLLKDCASFVTDEILYRFTDKLRFEFTGLDVANSETRWQEKLKHMTINEVRHMFDMPDHPLGWFGDLPADQGEQQAEFQRLNNTLTYGEGRKIWGQLPEYPSPMVNATPMNPSLGAVFMQALMSPEGGEDGGQDENGEGQEEGQEGDGGKDQEHLDAIHGRMANLGMTPKPEQEEPQDEKASPDE